MRDELTHLAKRAFSPNCVRGKPLNHQGRSISNEEVCNDRIEKGTMGDALIRGLWEGQTDAIIYVIFGDADCSTYNK